MLDKKGNKKMKGYMFTDGNEHLFKRINKTDARIAYNKGLTIVICPCKLTPFTYWHPECIINKTDYGIDEIGEINDFDNVVNSFEWYNCNNSETGKYSAFYIQVAEN